MLKKRIITAVIALLALGVVLFAVPAEVAEIVIAVFIVAAAGEWSGFLDTQKTWPRVIYVAVIALLMGASYYLLPGISALQFKIALAWWLVAFVWCLVYPTGIPAVVRWVAGALVLIPLFVALLVLYRVGPEVLLFALLIVWAADAGAFFAGKRFGRVKLAASISPGKTWEGVVGGLAVVALLAIVAAQWTGTRVSVLLPFCLAVAALSIVGDLTVSMFKRTAGVKDSGTLFPGHGGILDRVDSVAAAAPLFAFGLGWLELA